MSVKAEDVRGILKPYAPEHRTIYLSPKCCEEPSVGGRHWCQDNVWPCQDCPDPQNAVVDVYTFATTITPEPIED